MIHLFIKETYSVFLSYSQMTKAKTMQIETKLRKFLLFYVFPFVCLLFLKQRKIEKFNWFFIDQKWNWEIYVSLCTKILTSNSNISAGFPKGFTNSLSFICRAWKCEITPCWEMAQNSGKDKNAAGFQRLF